MAFNSKEKVIAYMEACINKFKLTELENVLSDHFDITLEEVERNLLLKKVKISKRTVLEFLFVLIKKRKWQTADILKTSFNIELDYILGPNKRHCWVAHMFKGDSSKEEISDLGSDIRRAIRSDGKDALVLVKEADGLFWISIIMKELKEIGLYKKPFYIALSHSGKYFFIKTAPPGSELEVLGTALGYKDYKKIKLSGRNIRSLLLLLERRERVNMKDRPVFSGGEAIRNEYGIDATKRKCYEDYHMACLDNEKNIDIENYTITAVDCPWLGDDTPRLRGMKFDCSVTFSGDVSRIIKQLPIAGIVKPPFPDFVVNFSVNGKNWIRKNKYCDD